MWWDYKKLSEDGDKVIYSYKCRTQKGTGKLEYDKKHPDDVKILEIASDDDYTGADWAADHLWSKIHKEGLQDDFLVAIG
jgi:hypothetical protein